MSSASLLVSYLCTDARLAASPSKPCTESAAGVEAATTGSSTTASPPPAVTGEGAISGGGGGRGKSQMESTLERGEHLAHCVFYCPGEWI